jgi:GNAT superfamily N-acetyltransferase
MQEHNAQSVEITVMAVASSLHRHGIGTRLVAAAEKRCVDSGVHWLHVKTRGPATFDEDYELTRRFYRALGFEPLYESLTEWGPEDAALVLVKHLDCGRTD